MTDFSTTPDQRLARVCAKRFSPTLLRRRGVAIALAVLPVVVANTASAGVPSSIRKHGIASIEGAGTLGADGRARVRVNTPGRAFDLVLEPSPIVAAGAQTITIDDRGEHRAATIPSVYRGHLADDPDAEVRVALTGHSLIGSVKAADDTWFFEPLERYEHGAPKDRTIVYRKSDIDVTAEPGSCGAEQAPLAALAAESTTSEGGTASVVTEALATTTGLVELSVIADSKFYASHGAATEAYMHSIIDQVAGFYPADIGVTVSIVNTVIYQSAGAEPFSASTASGTLLSSLAQQRQQKPSTFGVGDITHLFTGRDLDQNVIGIAYLGTVCNSTYAASLAQDFSTNLHLMTLLTGHELGHSLGASHDGQSGSPCSAVDFGYVMWPSIYSSLAEEFSACSAQSIAPVLEDAWCVGDAVSTSCGDGVLDANEACDDGNNSSGDCCRSDCQFDASGAACAADPNVCTNDVCNGAGTCVHPFNTAPCDDHDACSADGQCATGACVATTDLAPMISARLKSRLRGPGEDSMTVSGVLGASALSIPTSSGATVRFLDSAGGVIHESVTAAAGWVDRNGTATSLVFDTESNGLLATAGGISLMRVRYKPTAGLAKFKVRMADTDLSFLEGRDAVNVQVLLGSAASGDCGTTLSLVCEATEGQLQCSSS